MKITRYKKGRFLAAFFISRCDYGKQKKCVIIGFSLKKKVAYLLKGIAFCKQAAREHLNRYYEGVVKVAIRITLRGLLGVFVILLMGCGGSGGDNENTGNGSGGIVYSGATSPASVSNSNAADLGVGTTDAISQAVESNSADVSGLPFGASISDTTILAQRVVNVSLQAMVVQQELALPAGITLGSGSFPSGTGYCGGSVTVPDSWLTGGASETSSGVITYNNLCMDSGFSGFGSMIINGVATISGGVTTYSDLTVSFEDGTLLTCNASDCEMSAVYAGPDGVVYRVADVGVVGDSTSGYSVDASYCHGTHGCLTVMTDSPIVFSCSNGRPESGSISFSSTGGSSGSITFNSCTSYTVTYTTMMGGGSDSFSGGW